MQASAAVDVGMKTLVASNNYGIIVSTLKKNINSRGEERCIESKGRRVGVVHFEDGHNWTSHHIAWLDVESGWDHLLLGGAIQIRHSWAHMGEAV